MLPVTSIRACKLSEVVGPAISLPAGPYDQTFLVTEGDTAHAIFLDGPHRFAAFPSAKAENWKGAVIEDIRIEVERESIYSLASEGLQLGSIIFRGRVPCLVVRVKNGAWTDTERIPLVEEEEESGSNPAEPDFVGFKSWRATIWNGENWETVFDLAAVAEQ